MNETLSGQATAAEPTDESRALVALHAALSAAKNNAAVPVAAAAPSPVKDEVSDTAAAPSPSAAPDAIDAAARVEPVPVEHGIGVLLVNLGTPEAANAKAVRAYLKEFLTDR